ncbi:MAG: hypothetical protein ACETWG_03815 [Candidatus Neomarinimicrobiota bacterium]
MVVVGQGTLAENGLRGGRQAACPYNTVGERLFTPTLALMADR